MTVLRRAMPGVTLGLLAAVIASDGRPAQAYCTIWCHNWSAYASVPVYVSTALDDNMRHADGTLWTFTEVVYEVKWALRVMNEYSDANLPLLYYAGPAPAGNCFGIDCQVANAIVVAPSGIGTECTSWVCDCRNSLPECNGFVTTSTGMVVNIGRSMEVCPGEGNPGEPRYEHWIDTVPCGATCNQDFVGVFLHELSHAVGLDHCAGTCTSSPCNLANLFGNETDEGTQPYIDDTYGLRSMYGNGAYPNRWHRESDSGIIWYNLVSTGIPTLPPLFSLSSATGTVAAGRDTMVLTHRDPSNLDLRVSTWDFSSYAWTLWQVNSGEDHHGMPGAAFDPATGNVYSFNLWGEIPSNVMKKWRMTRHTAPGASTAFNWIPGTLTRRPGVSGAFDPKTGMLIQAWRDTAGFMRLQAVAPTTGAFTSAWQVTDGGGLPIKAYDSPTIACGAGTITLNCLLVWVAPATPPSSLYPTMKSMHFAFWNNPLLGYQLIPGPVISTGQIMEGPPVVSYRGPDTSSSAFVVAWTNQQGTTASFITTSMHKDSTQTGAWAGGAVHGPFTTRPFAGAGATNGYAEIIQVRR